MTPELRAALVARYGWEVADRVLSGWYVPWAMARDGEESVRRWFERGRG
jgi:hypothetical protein